MLAPTPPHERDDQDRGFQEPVRGVIPVLIVIVLLAAFAVAGGWLMITLIEHDKLRSCFASGRHNCAPIVDQ